MEWMTWHLWKMFQYPLLEKSQSCDEFFSELPIYYICFIRKRLLWLLLCLVCFYKWMIFNKLTKVLKDSCDDGTMMMITHARHCSVCFPCVHTCSSHVSCRRWCQENHVNLPIGRRAQWVSFQGIPELATFIDFLLPDRLLNNSTEAEVNL